ncbi:hypothetical protein [Pelagicoccus sp. SDUM812005]|uniref:FitA-like ribbon-helix-helix domain-containing protein n=1 Tax=Pelagicoccus sp. SDUM812005 TaxID=3041257 RepID=UPI00280F6EA2|nr:hypothetical protein [Pelagicoccus sp. SDUM812005]MDQ8180820.1 hypothetical protein [Pelagicoccus sp. SDUM812005]
MKSITIHKLDADLAEQLEKRARRDGTSLNRTVKSILRTSLGLDRKAIEDHRSDFTDLFGSWSQEDASAFDERTSKVQTVNSSDWER